MKRYFITTGTITYAIKGRDLLRKNRISAKIERITSGAGSSGCGYTIVVEDKIEEAIALLSNAGIKILEINEN